MSIDLTRRKFLGRIWKAGAALIAAAGAWTTWDLLQPLATSGFGGMVRTIAPAAVPDAGAVEVIAAKSHLVKIDGGEPTRLTDGPGYDGLPSFSPDGSRIVFESSLEKAPNGMTPPPGADICTIALDGSDYRCLTHEPDVYEGHASWSPSGDSIVFHSLRHGRYKEIYIMAADGTDRRRLTHTNEETVSR